MSDELATSLLPMFGAPDISTLGRELLQGASSKCERSAGSNDHSEGSLVHCPTGALAPDRVRLVAVVGHQHELGAPVFGAVGPVNRRSNGSALGPSRSGSISMTVRSLASRYSGDWTILP